MQSMTNSKRGDWRTAKRGTFEHYVLHELPSHSPGNWHPEGLAFDMAQPYYTAKHKSGHHVHLEGGRPAMKPQAVHQLDGYTPSMVWLAIEIVRRKWPVFVDALEWHQAPAALRPSRHAWAEGYSERDLTRMRNRALLEAEKVLPRAKLWLERPHLMPENFLEELRERGWRL